MPEKLSCTFPKIQVFQTKKKLLYLPEKTIFQTKNLLDLSKKLNFLYLRQKVKAHHLTCVLNTGLLIFTLGKLNKVFNKLLRALVCAGIYI